MWEANPLLTGGVRAKHRREVTPPPKVHYTWKAVCIFGALSEEATDLRGTVTEIRTHFKTNQLFVSMNLAEQSSYFTLALFKHWVPSQSDLACYLNKERRNKKNYPKTVLKSTHGEARPPPSCISKSYLPVKALLKSNWCQSPMSPKPCQPSTHHLQQVTHFMLFLSSATFFFHSNDFILNVNFSVL